MSSDDEVTTEVRDGAGIITLNRPDRLNALTHGVMVRLRQALLAFGGRDDIGAIILRGEGRAFCSGLDLGAGIGDPDESDPAEAFAVGMEAGVSVILAMREVPQPVISVIQGHAVGAGFSFAAASDLRFIGPEARFSAPFLKIGMTVGDLGLSWFLPRIMGAGRASALFYSAGVLDAEQAVDAGLAEHISEDPFAEALDCARRIAGFPRYGVRTSKRLIDAGAQAGLREHLEAEARAQVVAGLSRPAQEAMAELLAATKENS